MSKFDIDKEEYRTYSMYLPVVMVTAIDRIAAQYPAMTRSKICEMVLRSDIEIQVMEKQIVEETE